MPSISSGPQPAWHQKSDVSERDDNVVQIPSSSFTAFRFLYATPSEASHLATSVLLGKVPEVWIKCTEKRSLLSNETLLRPSTRTCISRTAFGVKKRVARYTGFGLSGLQHVHSGITFDETHTHTLPSEIWEEAPTEGSSMHETQVNDAHEYLATSDIASMSSENFDGILYGKISGHVLNLARDDVCKCWDQIESPDRTSSSKLHSQTSKLGASPTKGPSICKTSRGDAKYSMSVKRLSPANDESVHVCEEKDTAGGVESGENWTDEANHKPRETCSLSKAVDPSDFEQGFCLADLDRKQGEEMSLERHSQAPSALIPEEKRAMAQSSCAQSKPCKAKRREVRVQFANTSFEEQAQITRSQKEYVIAEKEHYRTIRKMRALARKSRGYARVGSSKLKLKLVDNISRKGRVGEIIRSDKMLVMIKKVCGISTVPSSTDLSVLDASVQDHWREYFVVLRTTDSASSFLRIQLFEADKGKNFERRPEHAFDLSTKTRANFYSHTDKTISVVGLVEDGVRLFIMSPKYTNVAYKWLYVIKEILGEDFYSMVNVLLAGESTQIKITIPRQLLKVSLADSKVMKLYMKPVGYAVETDALHTHVRSQINSHLRNISITQHLSTYDWTHMNPDPGFCFKFYDRIEWVPNIGKSLVARSQLLREEATLEYRQISKVPLLMHNLKGETINRPVSIEGFLSWINDTSRQDILKLKALYKVYYFFSSDNILFFSSFWRSIPPSPHNELAREDADREHVCNLLPDIYQRNPFEMDENEHIHWLQGPDFEKLDDEAVEEFSRRIQLIVSARAMIDLTVVSIVRPLSLETVHSRHLRFHLCVWSPRSAVSEDMKIIDSGFEIEFLNGGSLKLLAPLRAIRDEWVERLNALVIFWKLYRAQLKKAEASFKHGNMSHLLLEDYIDSNLTFSLSGLDIRRSITSDLKFTISGLAMSTCILCSGYLYQKHKKHSNFSQYFVVLCPGYLLTFSLSKRSKASGVWKNTPYFERYMTLPISECYVYSGSSTQLDLVGSQNMKSPGECDLPRLYNDGWRSSEEEFMRCFSIWFGGKRALRHGCKNLGLNSVKVAPGLKNPGIVRMTRRLGVTGKILIFLAKSRQEREHWVENILHDINRFSND